MEKNAFMSAAEKVRIALAVMAVCGMSFAGGDVRLPIMQSMVVVQI